MYRDHDAGQTEAGDAIVRRKLSDQVFDRLWRMIRSGELAPGDAMPSERALMDKFKVGRPAVREALQSLAGKGLISISQGERSRVNRLTPGLAVGQIDEMARLMLSTEPSGIENLKQVRRIVEAASVRIAAENCAGEDIAELRDMVGEQRLKLGREREFIEADIAFHMKIATLTGNPIIRSATQAMLGWLFEYFKPMLHWSGGEANTLREHDRIVDFIEARDGARAESAMIEHLNRSGVIYDPH